MNFFTAVFFALCVVCAIVTWLQRKNGDQAASENVSQEFRKCQRAYLIAYFCAVTADWLQGPYVYALYEHYKFTKGEIGNPQTPHPKPHTQHPKPRTPNSKPL
jgi:hypothetical protein